MLNSVTYLVTAENRPDVLSRVVLLFHRLAVPIDALTVKRSAKSQTLTLRLEAEVIRGQAERVAENVMKLVYVLSVEIRHRRLKQYSGRKSRSGAGR
jgi:acetolactate synthase small subunit